MNVQNQSATPISQVRDQATLVAAEGVGMSFQGRQILSDVDLTVNRGEIVPLIGLNG